MLSFAPTDPAHFVIRDKRRIGPDAVLVEPPANPAAERRQIRVIHKHHHLAERSLPQENELIEDEHAEDDPYGQSSPVIRRLRARQRQQRRAAPASVSVVLKDETRVGEEKPDAE